MSKNITVSDPKRTSIPRHDGRLESPRRIRRAELLGTACELIIEHGGGEYRLRLTSNDKLILTK